MNKKKIERLLSKVSKITKKIYKLNQKKKFTDNELDYWYEYISNPPKKSLLKMSQVKKLYKLRKKGKWSKKDFIYVIEPQNYDRISKLKPDNMMFEKDNFIKTKKYYIIGYFHSGTSGFAHSGDGGDYGDTWWLVNKCLENWLIYILKKGEEIYKKFK